ncbi:zinc finger and BTB domain-containing protein 38 [Acipenser oxyrinchus oxyrinchus]|uniref:Zinc finger and BTB domain-containing protein 38 n=1 Tax=Acipenser oxyrinchus oxyrinchus TaxID=40147 RepID=A0AAD8CMT4_ACIOX|nr:zinc finger and BTB domain-containing protein 38 [Acipenser oxyrinchus oxyrinchus]
MVSMAEALDSGHPSALLSHLNNQRTCGGLFCDITLIVGESKFRAHQNILSACSLYFKELLSSSPPPPPPPPLHAPLHSERVLELPELKPDIFADVLDYIYTSRVYLRGFKRTKELAKAGKRLGIPFLENIAEEQGSKSSKTGIKAADVTTTTAQPSDLPCNFAPRFLGGNEQEVSSYARPEVSASAQWRMAASASVQTQQQLNPRAGLQSPSPVDLTAPARKDSESHQSSSPIAQFQSVSHLLPPQGIVPTFPATGLQPLPPETTTPRTVRGTGRSPAAESYAENFDSERSTAETAKILFTLRTAAFKGMGNNSETAVRKAADDAASEDGFAGANSTAEGLLPLPPPPEHLGPTRPSAKGFLCRVCKRSFSSASSLSTHLKLHRAERALSCRHCGRAFIHNKRLQSHEAVCREAPQKGLPAPMAAGRPKKLLQSCEQGEEGEEETGEEKEEEEEEEEERNPEPEPSGAKSSTNKKGRGIPVRHRSFQRMDLLAEEDHFVKVVDGHIIYFCTVCERSYMTLSSLKRHSNVHSWRRKYPCRYCEKVFALAEYRTKHEVWHTGERRYQCIFCWEAFVTYYNLKTHQKSFHGINPGLISSEKTANGGYKQKLNALKLYRLLPMRSQKRAYKTYSPALSESILMPSLTAPLDNGLPESPGSEGLCSLGLHPGGAGDYIFPAPLDPAALEPGEITNATGPHNQSSPAMHGIREGETDEEAAKSLLESRTGFPSADGSVNTVIAYGHPKPSVIVHGTAVSSVIVHSNQVASTSANNRSSSSSSSSSSYPSRRPSSEPSKVPPPIKKQVLKEYIQSQKRASSEETEEEEGRRSVGEDKRSQKPCKSSTNGNSVTYVAKPAYVGASSETRGGAPLCQITVRIGEEAIVKRSISETDLMRDKGPPANKTKRMDPLHKEMNQHQYQHQHHKEANQHQHQHRNKETNQHQRQHLHLHCNKETNHHQRQHLHHNKEAEPEKKKKKCKASKLREYNFRREVREEESDQDAEDNLWRPYYTYKPKRKTLHVQKVKKSSWRRKLRYKRSLRLMKRAEKLLGRSLDEGGDCKSSTGLQDEQGAPVEEEEEEEEDCQICEETFPDFLSLEKHERNHRSGKAFECPTCGRQFSTVKKLDKHELTHLMEFVCLRCQESFRNRALMEAHQKTHQVESENRFPQERAFVTESKETGYPEKSNLPRLGRRPSVRHTCTSCSKVCKTVAALGRHMKRHETEREDSTESGPELYPTAAAAAAEAEAEATDLGHDLEANRDQAKSIPVINYTTSAADETSEDLADVSSYAPQYDNPGKTQIESDQATPTQLSEISSNNEQEVQENPGSSPLGRKIVPPPGSPEAAPPARAEVPSSSVQSVLVLNSRDCLDSCQQQEAVTSYRAIRSPVGQPQGPLLITGTTEHCEPGLRSQSYNRQDECTDHQRHTGSATLRVNGTAEGTVRSDEGNNAQNNYEQDTGPYSYQSTLMMSHARREDDDGPQNLVMSHAGPTPPPPPPEQAAMSRAREGASERGEMESRGQEELPVRAMMSHAGIEAPLSAQELMMSHLARDALPAADLMRTHMGRAAASQELMMSRNGRSEGLAMMMMRVPQKEEKPPATEFTTTQTTAGTANTATAAAHGRLMPQTTTSNKCPHKRIKSPSLGANTLAQELLKPHLGPNATVQDVARMAHEGLIPQNLMMPRGTGDGVRAENPLAPRQSEELQDSAPQDLRMATTFPVQEFPLPLLAPAGCRSSKKHQESPLLSYPAAAMQFGDLGKMSSGDLAKLPFYPDPYQLLYGPQLLAYPYNLAALPMALNMVVPNEKGQPLPFLPTLFSYVNPCTGLVQEPHLVAKSSRRGDHRDAANQ